MKRTVLLLILFAFNAAISAQSLQHPESVAYDVISKTFFISNPGNRSISMIQPGKDTALFAGNLRIPLGLLLNEGLLWCADSSRMLAFNLDGSIRHELEIPNAKQLNGIIADGSRNIYISDRRGNAILRIDLRDLSYDTVLYGSISIPNGIAMAGRDKLLVVNSTETASIFLVDIQSGKILNVFPANRAYLDGITRIQGKKYLISSWGEKWVDPAILCFNLNTKGIPRIVMHGEGSCADIRCFPSLKQLGIPMYYENRLRLVDIDSIKACFEN